MATKTKPAAPDFNAQILLALYRLTSQVEALVRTHDATKTKQPDICTDWSKAAQALFAVPNSWARPTLKWSPLLTSDINWCVRCDPAEFTLLKPGQTITLDGDGALSFNGLRFGTMPGAAIQGLEAHAKEGAKFHAYLTTARQVAVKVGYPAQ
jgi:hypothetical protein